MTAQYFDRYFNFTWKLNLKLRKFGHFTPCFTFLGSLQISTDLKGLKSQRNLSNFQNFILNFSLSWFFCINVNAFSKISQLYTEKTNFEIWWGLNNESALLIYYEISKFTSPLQFSNFFFVKILIKSNKIYLLQSIYWISPAKIFANEKNCLIVQLK